MPHLGMSLEKSPVQSSAVSGECFAGDGNTLATGGEGIFMPGEGFAGGDGRIAGVGKELAACSGSVAGALG